MLNLSKSTVVVSVTALCLLTVFIIASGFLWSRYNIYQDEIDSLTPKISRFIALSQSQSKYESAIAEADRSLAQTMYPGSSEIGLATSEMQSLIKTLLEDTGMSVTGSQVLPPKEGNQVISLYIDITASGSMESLGQSLVAIEQQTPLLFVESITLQPLRVRRGQSGTQSVNARIKLYSLKFVGQS